MSADTETRERTLADVSFETFSTAKLALQERSQAIGDDPAADRYQDALAELVDRWNAANGRGDDGE